MKFTVFDFLIFFKLFRAVSLLKFEYKCANGIAQVNNLINNSVTSNHYVVLITFNLRLLPNKIPYLTGSFGHHFSIDASGQ